MKALFFVLALILSSTSQAQDFKARLEISPTKQAVREFCARFGKLGKVKEAEYQTEGTRLFLCWVEGGENPIYLFGYVLRDAKWHLLIDHPEDISLANGKVVVSVVDNNVRVLGKDGSTLKTYSLARK